MASAPLWWGPEPASTTRSGNSAGPRTRFYILRRTSNDVGYRFCMGFQFIWSLKLFMAARGTRVPYNKAASSCTAL